MAAIRAGSLFLTALVALGSVAAADTAATSSAAITPREVVSPPGQIAVVTVNAKQGRVLDVTRFERLYQLVRALRTRPQAFSGGAGPSAMVPDVIIVEEMRPSNVEIFQRLLRQSFSHRYAIVGAVDAAAKLLVNEELIEATGETVPWGDVCTSEGTPTDGRTKRDYQFGRFIEKATGASFVVAGIEFAAGYGEECRSANAALLRSQLAGESVPTIIGGDFNRRATAQQHECDPNEESEPQAWWTMLTSPPDGGRAYVDAVQSWHRARGLSIGTEWTHEQHIEKVTCNGSRARRRTRIDYLFSAGAVVAQAHADHPGWAGRNAGERHPGNFRYSDHRFVWGRFVISGPPQPVRPAASPSKGGEIGLAWQPVEGATGYVLYRGRAGGGYSVRARLGGDVTSFRDSATTHHVAYRYAVAAVGADGGEGLESPAVWERGDARGPRVTAVRPRPGARGIDPRAVLEARFDETAAQTSIRADSVMLFRGKRRIAGRVIQVSGRTLVFDPARRLPRGRRFTAAVRPLRDLLGNSGTRAAWKFETAPRPKSRR